MSATQAFTAPGGHDAALTQEADDLLDRWPVAKLIYRMITATPSGWSTRIGLYGQWGSGKTSVLNFLQQIAEDADDIVVRFPAWQISGEAGFVAQFYLELTAVLQRKGQAEALRPWLQRLSKKVTDTLSKVSNSAAQVTLPESVEYAPVISAAAHVSGVVFDKLSGMLQLQAEDLNALRAQLGRRRVIVFIDDLDRADPKVIPQTLLALRELLDWPDFVFVLAFDKELVSRALSGYSAAFGESAQHFLDKIIDIPFALPEPTPKQVQKMAARHLKDCCPFLLDETIEQTAEWFPANPRQAKRICRSLSVFGAAADRHADDELDWRGIILQTLLRETEPKVALRVEENMLGFHSAWRPAMFNQSNAKEQEQHKHAALAAAQHPQDELKNKRLLRLLDELGKARSKLSLERINYEMSLATREVEFTIPEFSQLLDIWREQRSPGCIHHFILTAASRSGAAETVVASAMLNIANIQYGQLLGRTASIYSRQEFEQALHQASELLALIEFFYSDELDGAMSVVRTGHAICLEYIRRFFYLAGQTGSAGERRLRERELPLLRVIAGQCDDAKRLYLDVEPNHRKVFVPCWQEQPAVYQHYMGAIQEVTAPRLVDEAINQFGLPYGVNNVFLEDDAQLRWVLTADVSPLYTGKTRDYGCEQFKALIHGAQELSGKAIIAKNALSYLGLFISSSESSYVLLTYQAHLHLDYIRLAWQAVSQLEPTLQTLTYLKVLKGSLEALMQAPEGLSTPVWWDGRPGDIESELPAL
ncbi:AAA family ATPase [Pseudomonas sp. Fl5BN2]|uniref:KAP family P-loop NTPase fold protein n=1 Tax=unclassified Pseudomonas TaxID=196821 RepID=UPI001376D137|nr:MULTISPECIES: P-loop NTPase fold protein [unclassified Pseudomonas]NBF05699.1 AAA family ATPase [Pseudomonas sp. Fl5BN2]NBF11616.1 AAA family ATPase [Pseudomonas sp. Fl4BN1]